MINFESKAAGLLAGALVAVLAVILVAGLWPFNPFPVNNVAWMKSRNGLSFGKNPVVVSRSPLNFVDPRWSSISLEIWLQPTGSWQIITFLSIYRPENPEQFRMMFDQNIFLIRRNRRDATGQWADTAIGVDNAVFPNTPLFITITSGPQGSAMYFNGRMARAFPGYVLTGRDLSGQLIFGTSPFSKQTWHGEWRGLAIYGAELSAADVLAHYQKWMEGRQTELAKELVAKAVYDFHEGTGDTIHDLAGVAPDLFIPKHYSVPHKGILQWPWNEYHPDLSVVADIAVNIAGFVPLGFLLCAFLRSRTRNQRSVLTTVLIGALISLTMEFLQAYIPQRSSGITDIMTNSLGTAIGAILWEHKRVKALLARITTQT